MINRIVLPALIAGLVLTFFVLEVSGHFPALPAVLCMAVLYLAWRWFGPPRVEKARTAPTLAMKWLSRVSRLLWLAMGLLILLMFIGGILTGLKDQRHGSPSSIKPANARH